LDISVPSGNLTSRANGATEKKVVNIKVLMIADTLADSVKWAC
jgi:hypothetical protein